jgi:PKD repeat protein
MMKNRLFYLLGLALVTLLGTTLLLAAPALVAAGPGAQPPLQAPSAEWIIWEMEHPPQSLLLEGDTLWAGSYRGGLYRWHVELGYQAHYTAAHGLVGEDVVGLALDGSGNKLVAALDGGLSTGDGAFAELTPPGGERARDLAVTGGGEVWLASLGGGVARYSGGGWTVYTTANSGLPFDDVYAVALEGTTPWAGTMGYGLARLDGGDWVTYTLPVDIPHPVTPTTAISNPAVADIAVDGGGNKWLATDGSGVVVLDSSNSQWTVYDTANSGLPDNFVHAVTLDGAYRWFGTLGAGVARLDTSSGAWEVLHTGNSLLPEDDVLAIAVDANGGQWFATFDAGLTFHGQLPATPPTLDLDPRRVPEYNPGGAKSYYLWLDPDTYIWHLAWSGDGQSHTFEGTLVADTAIVSATATCFDAGDSLALAGDSLSITATEAVSQDLVSFVLDRQATQLTANLKIDGAYRPFNIRVGEAGARPPTAPFRLVPPQPVPPAVAVAGEASLEEGAPVFLTGVLTDTDSPLGHRITWYMGDGSMITDTLTPQHTYTDDGLFDVTLAITDVHGEVSSDGMTITVSNVAPEADFYYDPPRPEPGQVLTFTGSAYDPGLADSHSYAWDFGDGISATGSLTLAHSYAASGTYNVTLTVADDDGGLGVISYPVGIEPFGADFVGYPGVGLPPFTATFYDTSAGMVTTRTWTFGDGSPPVTTGTTTINHLYQTPGIYTVGLAIYGPSGEDVLTRPGYILALSPETSGTIILEAEDYTRQIVAPGPAWETRTARPGYSGSGYVQANPDVDALFDTGAIGVGSELQYDLGLSVTGTYTIWLRGYAANAAGDSVYLGLDGQPITSTDYVSAFPPARQPAVAGTWAWANTWAGSGQPITFTIEIPGVHTLYLWVREDGFSLDQIILTTEENFTPGG